MGLVLRICGLGGMLGVERVGREEWRERRGGGGGGEERREGWGGSWEEEGVSARRSCT